MLHTTIFLLALLTLRVHTLPTRGHYPFFIALCNYPDNRSTPISTDKVAQFFTSAGSNTPGLFSFIQEQSHGAVDFEGSIVQGWFTTDASWYQFQTDNFSRQERIDQCRRAAAEKGFQVPSTHKFLALYNTGTDYGEIGDSNEIGGVLLRFDHNFGVAVAGHEVLHTLGEVHSRLAWDLNPPSYSCSQTEYCDQFDLMSTENLFTSFNDGVYTTAGPNLCAPGRERLGWLPMDRIFLAGVGSYKVPVRLTSLSQDSRSTSGVLMARIPIATPQGQPLAYYTVEFRNAVGWDRGLSNLGSNSGVVIHRVNETVQANWLLYPRFPDLSFGKPFSWFHEADDFFFDNAGGVLIHVIDVEPNGNFADIEITSSGMGTHPDWYGPNTCANGYVWRQADSLDYAYTSPDRRTKVQSDNAAAASRKLPGSDFCVQGFVWREAWPGDHVCVSPAERSTAQDESRRAYQLVANDFESRQFVASPITPVIP